MKDKNATVEKAGNGKWRTKVIEWKKQECTMTEYSGTENAGTENAGKEKAEHENEGILMIDKNLQMFI